MINSAVSLNGSQLEVTSMFGVKRTIARSDIRGLALRVTTANKLVPVPLHFAIIYGSGGRVIAKLRTEVWREEDLQQLHHALSPKESFRFQFTDPGELENEFPGSRSRYFGLIVGIAALAFVFGGTCLQNGRH
jgi:hypothetical protein